MGVVGAYAHAGGTLAPLLPPAEQLSLAGSDLPPDAPHLTERRAFRTALKAAGEALLADDVAMSVASGVGARIRREEEGRKRATLFEEEVLTPFVTSGDAAVAAKIDAALSALPGPWRYSFVSFEKAKGARPGWDLWLTLGCRVGTSDTVRVCQMVNAKYTRGETPDNTSGLAMARWALQGLASGSEPAPAAAQVRRREAPVRRLSQVYPELASYRKRRCDYYFLVFTHEGSQMTRLASSVQATSLLENDPSVAMRYNEAQSWPGVQFNFSQARQAPLHSITKERERLTVWLMEKQAEKVREAAAEHEQAYLAIGRTPLVQVARGAGGDSAASSALAPCSGAAGTPGVADAVEAA